MSLNVNVQGGTGGGKKKPMAGPAEEWFCLCPSVFAKTTGPGPLETKLNRAYLVRCPDCKMERPS